MKKLFVTVLVGAALASCQKQPASANPQTAVSGGASAIKTAAVQATATVETYDGPFGLAPSLSGAELERLNFKPVASHPGVYEGTPPRPLEGTDKYVLVVAPKAGLCRINTTVIVNPVNGSGDQLRAAVDRIADMMQMKYGKHSLKADFKEDVHIRNPQYWMLGLKDDSVMYGYVWNSKETEKALPNDIAVIEVSARTRSLDSGFVSIQYSFKNFDDCVKEINQKKAENL